jgi:hypothetical protein
MNPPNRLLHAAALAAAAFVTMVAPTMVRAEDEIDLMLRRGHVPPTMTGTHGYSDFTDPLGRFLDLLAAGALAEARSIQGDACAEWLATRQNSAFAGKFWVWDTEINLDTLCAPH